MYMFGKEPIFSNTEVAADSGCMTDNKSASTFKPKQGWTCTKIDNKRAASVFGLNVGTSPLWTSLLKMERWCKID